MNIRKEVWKSITGYEGLYEVSNIGRVKSLGHKVCVKTKNGYNFEYISKERILKPVKNVSGYTQVNLFKNLTPKVINIHRLVAETFIPNIYNKPQVNHKNGIKDDNNVKNLEWVTPSENGLHKYNVLGVKPAAKGKFGKKSPKHRGVIQMDFNGNVIKKWDCAFDAVRKFGFDSSCITRCCQGKSKYHNGYKWKYETDKPYKKNRETVS